MDPERLNSSQDDDEVRKGPWTMEEDLVLMNYIANHGEGVWNSLAKAAEENSFCCKLCRTHSAASFVGLRRTGKSCRLRWLNYLRPDVRRGNITPEEEHLIIDLHSKWGNRWSKIARQLPGRTDNEIKNYWRTRIQKQMKQQQEEQQQEGEENPLEQMSVSCSEINEEQSVGTSGQFSGFDMAETMEICPNSFPSPQANMEDMSYEQPSLGCEDGPPDSDWSMEDLWSMQLFD